MRFLALIRMSLVAIALAALIGCSSGAPATLRPGATPVPQATAVVTPAGGLSSAEGLCGMFEASLAVAALGGPVDQPKGGDVVPRPSGIYCHYKLTGDPGTNVEAQLKDMPRSEFESLAELLGADTPVAGVGEAAFRRDSSSMGGSGATVVAWAGGQGVSVILNREGGDQALVNAAAEAIAERVLPQP